MSTDIVEASAQAFLQVINRAAQKLGPARLNPYDVQPVAAAQEAAGS